jgi:hypothetical protein
VLKLSQVAQRPNEDLLHRILGVFPSAKQPQRPAVDHRAMLMEERPYIL